MTPDEVLRLKPPQKKSEGGAERIVAPGQMLIFISGHRPVSRFRIRSGEL